MAHVYVDSNAGGAADGSDWANAYLTLAAALTAKSAGDNFWVAQDHAETQASAMTCTSPGTIATPCTIICVNKAGSVPPVAADLATTATVTTTGANGMTLTGGMTYAYGITFSAGSGATNAGISISGVWFIDTCPLKKLGTTGSGGAINFGAANSEITLRNSPITLSALTDQLSVAARFTWENTPSALAGTAPTTLFRLNAAAIMVLEGVDLSSLGSGKTIVPSPANGPHDVLIKDCKLGASVTLAARSGATKRRTTRFIRCDSGDTNYMSSIPGAYEGDLTTETTIVRTGGATDGTTPIAWKIITTADAKWMSPFECFPITIWNETVGSAITVTLYGYHNDAAVPNNDEIWMDVEYLGTSGFPQGNFATTNKASYLATAAALTEDTASTWGGGDTTTRFVLAATFTPQEIGPITLYVKAAKASATFYIDPEPAINDVTVSKSFILAPGVYANERHSGPLGHGNMTGGMQ